MYFMFNNLTVTSISGKQSLWPQSPVAIPSDFSGSEPHFCCRGLAELIFTSQGLQRVRVVCGVGGARWWPPEGVRSTALYTNAVLGTRVLTLDGRGRAWRGRPRPTGPSGGGGGLPPRLPDRAPRPRARGGAEAE